MCSAKIAEPASTDFRIDEDNDGTGFSCLVPDDRAGGLRKRVGLGAKPRWL